MPSKKTWETENGKWKTKDHFLLIDVIAWTFTSLNNMKKHYLADEINSEFDPDTACTGVQAP